ncbi:MAG: acyl-CoA thioesterase domain-containing protein, partial [Aquihabitans sp.]
MGESLTDGPGDHSVVAYEFDVATAARPRRNDLHYDIDIDPGWTVGFKPNGGYLLATAARAAGLALGTAGSEHRDPLAATAHFIRAPEPGPAEARVEVLRAGRSASQARTTIWQDQRACVDATFTMATLPVDPVPPWWSDRCPFDLPAIEDCQRIPGHREGAPFP